MMRAALVAAIAIASLPARADVSGTEARAPLVAACRTPDCTRVAEQLSGDGDALEVWRLETKRAVSAAHDSEAEASEIRLAVRTPRGWWFSPIVEKIETETGAHSNEPTLTSAGVERRGHGVRWRYRIAGHSISMCAQQIGDYLSDIETDVAPRQKPRRRIVHQEATSSPIRF